MHGQNCQYTVAERDTAAAAQAALGPPESRHWPPKGCPSAAAGCRGSAAATKTLKSLFSHEWVTGQCQDLQFIMIVESLEFAKPSEKF